MTTIAWDGRTLAGDRQINAGNTPLLREHPKVLPINSPDGERCLMGFAGDVFMYRAWLHWLDGGAEPKWKDDVHWSLLLIDPTGYAWIRTSTSNGWAPHGRTVWAIGSGCDYALGALRAGATAERAVMIAAELDINTGLGIDKVALQEEDPSKLIFRTQLVPRGPKPWWM
jgi:ATP-dependent protease HslVU (ClpYQ) peptidase subunit